MGLFGRRFPEDVIQDVGTAATTEVTATQVMAATDITDGRTGMAAVTTNTGALGTDTNRTTVHGTASDFPDAMSRENHRRQTFARQRDYNFHSGVRSRTSLLALNAFCGE